MRSAWQQKPGVMHRYAKDTILKTCSHLFFCVSAYLSASSKNHSLIVIKHSSQRQKTKSVLKSTAELYVVYDTIEMYSGVHEKKG